MWSISDWASIISINPYAGKCQLSDGQKITLKVTHRPFICIRHQTNCTENVSIFNTSRYRSIWGISTNYLLHLDVDSRNMVPRWTANNNSESLKFADVRVRDAKTKPLTAIQTVAKVYKYLSLDHRKKISKVVEDSTLAWASYLPMSTLWAALAPTSSLDFRTSIFMLRRTRSRTQ